MSPVVHHLGLAVTDVPSVLEALEAAFGARRLEAPVAGHALLHLGELRLALVPLEAGEPRARARGDHLALELPAGARARAAGALQARGWVTELVRGRLYARAPDGMLTLELLEA